MNSRETTPERASNDLVEKMLARHAGKVQSFIGPQKYAWWIINNRQRPRRTWGRVN
jgi:hypothetical protein